MSEFIPKTWADQIAAQVTETSTMLQRWHASLTDEQRAEMAARRAAREAYEAELRDLLTNTKDATVRGVALLHRDDGHGYCEGCDFEGYEAEAPGWPCRTTVLLGELFGLEEPA